jgi:hypothetical protein
MHYNISNSSFYQFWDFACPIHFLKNEGVNTDGSKSSNFYTALRKKVVRNRSQVQI